MKWISPTEKMPLPQNVATIGFFDGVHRGHRDLLRQTAEVAHRTGLAALVITFAEHPRHVVQADYCPLRLTSREEKRNRLQETGMDYGVELPFTREMAALSAYEFMRSYLLRMQVQTLVVGYDHRFGHNREEGFADYVRHGARLGIRVLQAQPYSLPDGTCVSSTKIRRMLEEGDVEQAATALGVPYSLEGRVVEGHRLGRTLGFPTANVSPLCADQLVPARGVYIVRVWADGTPHPAMLNIGCRPTADNGPEETIEAHLLRFQGDLYGKTVRVEWIRHLRKEQKFASLDALKTQLTIDAHAASDYFRMQ